MKKLLMLACCVLALSGCEKETTEKTADYILPEGLADCQIFRMKSDKSYDLNVVRCPNSSTTTNYQAGKTPMSVTTISP